MAKCESRFLATVLVYQNKFLKRSQNTGFFQWPIFCKLLQWLKVVQVLKFWKLNLNGLRKYAIVVGHLYLGIVMLNISRA